MSMNNPTTGTTHTAATHTAPGRQDMSQPGWSSQDPAIHERTGTSRGPRLTVRSFSETKDGIKTTEFWIMLVAVAGILVATYADSDSFARVDGWKYVSWIVIAYVISRGLAKLGTREPSIDRID